MEDALNFIEKEEELQTAIKEKDEEKQRLLENAKKLAVYDNMKQADEETIQQYKEEGEGSSKKKGRGNTWISQFKNMNLIIGYGSQPGVGVIAKTDMMFAFM